MLKERDIVVIKDDPHVQCFNVDKIDEGVAHCYPVGGGFLHRIPNDKLRPATQTESKPPVRWGYFSGDWVVGEDDLPRYIRGFTFGESWNGWKIPYFTTANGLRLMQLIDPLGEIIAYDSEDDQFILKAQPGDESDYPCPVVYIEGMRTHRIGDGWCWDEFSLEYEDGVKGLKAQFANVPGLVDEIIARYEQLRKI